MEYEIPVNTHHPVGPVVDMYGHGPVTCIGSHIWACLDCGYTTHDKRVLLEVDCEREENVINQTWRERLDKYEFPDALDKRSGDRVERDGE